MFVVIGILLCLICIGLWLLLIGFLLIMTGGAVLLLIPLFGIRVVSPKLAQLAIRVNVDLASLLGPPGFLNSSWIQVDAGHISGADIAAWPYSVGFLVLSYFFFGYLTLAYGF